MHPFTSIEVKKIMRFVLACSIASLFVLKCVPPDIAVGSHVHTHGSVVFPWKYAIMEAPSMYVAIPIPIKPIKNINIEKIWSIADKLFLKILR